MSRRIPRDLDLRKKKKRPEKVLQSSDDFVTAGVDFEDSGDRWKGSDDPKAGRFYLRAIEMYESALQRNPNSFDARYNLARLQYQITQLSLPESFFPSESTEAQRLQAAAESHRQCLQTQEGSDNTDLLFNYAQALSSLAETLMIPSAAPATDAEMAKGALQEAATVFKSCLQLQETEVKERNEAIAAMSEASEPQKQETTNDISNQAQGAEDMDLEEEVGDMKLDGDHVVEGTAGMGVATTGAALGGGVKLDTETTVEENGANDRRRDSSVSSSSSTPGQWAVITEGATEDSLLDTAIALLETYTTYCSLPPAQLQQPVGQLEEVEKSASELIEGYILPLAKTHESIERKVEALLARASFMVGLTEAVIKTRGAESMPEWKETWENNIKLAFEPYNFLQPETGEFFDFLTNSWSALCDRCTAYSSAASFAATTANDLSAAWAFYTRATKDLAAATKIAPDNRKSEIYLARGNLELERAMLSTRGSEAASKNQATLLKNAAVYYKAALNSGRAVIGASAGSTQSKAAAEACVKAAIVRRIQGETNAINDLISTEGVPAAVVKEVLATGVEDGLWTQNPW